MKIKTRKIFLIGLFFFLSTILLSRFQIIIHGFELIFLLLGRMFLDFSSFINELDLPTIDFVLSVKFGLFIVVLLLSLFLSEILKLKIRFFTNFFNKTLLLNIELFIGTLLVIFFIFIVLTAPVLIPHNPDYRKDIILTKHLSPFSQVNFLELELESSGRISQLKDELIYHSNENRRIYFDSLVLSGEKIIVKQRERLLEVELNQIVTRNNKPLIQQKTFLLGTDEFGRDLLSRILVSIRISLFIGLVAVLISFLIGGLIGYTAGYVGGFIDNILMRLVDFFLSFPLLFFAIFMIAFLGNSITLLIIIFGLSGWMFVARIARNETIALKNKEFIQTLRLLGQSNRKIVIKHIIPNSISPILITLVYQLSTVIIAESALSFLGLGVQPPTPTLGNIIKSGYDYITSSIWILTFSSITLILIVLAFNLMTNGLEKHFIKNDN